MKRLAFVVLVVAAGIYMLGCGKKDASSPENQEAVSMEALSALNANMTATAPAAAPGAGAVSSLETKSEVAPVTVASKPSNQDIQAALKNAGFYTGSVDGKIGPKTKKAIEAFQTANGIKADGKVGTKTWSLLSKHLNPAPITVSTPKKR